MASPSRELTLCSKCAALMSIGYVVKKTSVGVDKKVDCENCKRHHYGGTYILLPMPRRNEK